MFKVIGVHEVRDAIEAGDRETAVRAFRLRHGFVPDRVCVDDRTWHVAGFCRRCDSLIFRHEGHHEVGNRVVCARCIVDHEQGART